MRYCKLVGEYSKIYNDLLSGHLNSHVCLHDEVGVEAGIIVVTVMLTSPAFDAGTI